MLNRKQQPKYKEIEKINILKAKEQSLENNIPLYTINAGTEDIVRIDLIFNAGILSNPKPLIATITNSLIEAGTKKHTALQIAEKLDFYGAFLHHSVNKDNASISLYSLNKYLPETIKIFEDIIKNSIFPVNELEIYLQKKKQEFIVESEKVNVLSSRKFQSVLFGDKHPYGVTLSINDFKNVDQKQLSEHHLRHYNANSCKIIVSGNVDNKTVNLIKASFGKNDWINDNNILTDNKYIIKSSNKKQHIIEKEKAVQTAIRVGKVTINKLHDDFIGLQILNTVLGGYFGSRLMTNIREDKGYTYGIGSGLVSLQNAGYFTIVTEINSDFTKDTIKQIYFELDKLRNELIEDKELNTVRNYILGELLKAFDGPFALADSFRSILDYGLDYNYFDKYVKTVKNISSEELNKLANKYFKPEELIDVIAGKY